MIPVSASQPVLPPNIAPLPRRELFDIRAQIMAEADLSDIGLSSMTVGLSEDDIKPRIYEGGFKTWECAVDLSRYIAKQIQEDEIPLRGRKAHVIEVRIASPD